MCLGVVVWFWFYDGVDYVICGEFFGWLVYVFEFGLGIDVFV